MTPTTDPFDARAYDPYSIHLSPQDLPAHDREAVHAAVHPTPRWRWYKYLTLAAIAGCVLLATSHVWGPLINGGFR